MGRLPMRAILSVSILAGVITSGVVLVLTAPPSHAQRVREVGERAARSRAYTETIREALGQGDLETAATLSARHTDEFPQDPSAWMHFALTQQRLGNQADASDAWGALLELTRQPDNGRVYVGRLVTHARALYGVGDRRGALRLWGRAADLNTPRQGGWRLLHEHARDLAADGEHRDALALIHMAVDAGLRNEGVLLADPTFSPLLDTPAFRRAVHRIRSENMGQMRPHVVNNPQTPRQVISEHGETTQILTRDPSPSDELRAWVRRWGDL